jgi:hypothetical protein
VNISEEVELLPEFFMTVEGMDCRETNGHCERHSYSSDPQFFAERRQEFFPFKISELCLLKEHGIAEKEKKYFKIPIFWNVSL